MKSLRLALWIWLLVAVVAGFGRRAMGAEGEAQHIRTAEDRSLTTEQYVAFGMPAIDRAWTLDDYRQAARALREIAGKDPRELPRRGSPRSGKVFARMANAENLALIANQPVSIESRGRTISASLGATGDLLSVYIRASTPAGVFSAEVVDLYSLMLHLNVIVAQISEEFITSVPADDPTRPRRAEARVKLMRNIGQATRTTLGALSHPAFGRDERLRLVEQVRATLPKYINHLEEEQRQAIAEDLKGLSDRQNEKAVAEAIQGLLDAITTEMKGT